MLLQAAIDLWLGECKPSTAKSYKYVMRSFAAYVGPARPLTEVTPVDCIKYLQTISERESIHSPATFNKYTKTLRTFFNWCVKINLLNESPARATKRKKQSQSIPKDKAMPDNALNQLLDYCKWDTRADAYIRFLADTGCRVGGAANLTIDDVDIERKTARVMEKGKVEHRPVFFGDACARAMRRWLLERPHIGGKYVFSIDGHKMTHAALSQYFRRLCKKAKIGSYGPHSLRHRKGHQMADQRIAPSIAAQALGHESVSITLNYYYPKDWERVADVIRSLSSDQVSDTSVIDFTAKKRSANS